MLPRQRDPQLNDIVIEGSILSVQQGSAAERVTIGFAAGESQLKVAVEGFQMTPSGLRKLGSGDVGSTGNKTPGAAFGLATLIATHNPKRVGSAPRKDAQVQRCSDSNSISGTTRPSTRLRGALILFDIGILDHIVAGGGSASFAEPLHVPETDPMMAQV